MAIPQTDSGPSSSAPAQGHRLSDRTLIPLLRAPAAIGGGLAVVGSAAVVAMGYGGAWWVGYGAFVALLSSFFAIFVWLVAPHQPRNAVVWTMSSSAFFGGVFLGSMAIASTLDDAELVWSINPVPADLSTGAAWFLLLGQSIVLLAVFPLLTFGLLLFPDGSLPSPRWRWLSVFSGITILVASVGSVWGYRPWNETGAESDPVLNIAVTGAAFAIVSCLVALVVRFRRSRGVTREQFKWIVWGASIFVLAMILAMIFGDTRWGDLIQLPTTLASATFVVSYGIAVGKYRLFDIDVVISRTVVVAGLAGFITVVYAVLVLGVGLFLGDVTEAAVPLVIAATVVVAIAFQPLRTRMRQWADRLVYGERATPYEVLSRFSERMRDAVATEELIPQMAQLLTQGTGARRATVWMKTGNELRPAATWPEEEVAPAPVNGNSGLPSIPGVDHLALVEHDGEVLGAVTVTMPRGEALTITEQRLVDDVASQAGLVLRNARLTTDLVDTIAQLRSSRQRLVAAQDEERRRLERNLHDGAQQQLVALKVKLGLVRRVQDSGERDQMLQALMRDADDAIQDLRDLARGIYPPVLAEKGLVGALRGLAVKATVPTDVDSDGIGRYPAEVEAAVYFCVLEAMQNIAKYADATASRVVLHADDSHIHFDIEDNGRGFDIATTSLGAGLQNMTDRIEALGGTIQIDSAPGAGTTIAAVIPAVETKGQPS